MSSVDTFRGLTDCCQNVFTRPVPSRSFSTVACLALAPVLAACARKSDSYPFSIPPEGFFQQTEIIALTPVSMPEEIRQQAAAAGEFDSLIAAVLTDAGYSLVSVDDYLAVWGHILDQMGGVSDPITGERDEAKFELARERLYLDLSEMYYADAVLYPEIWTVDAPFAEGVASWDGTSQAMVEFGIRVLDFIGAILTRSESQLPRGTVRALSLMVFMEDMNGVEVFSDAGGIELLEQVGTDPGSLQVVPEEELFQDRERSRKAVDQALRRLVDRT